MTTNWTTRLRTRSRFARVLVLALALGVLGFAAASITAIASRPAGADAPRSDIAEATRVLGRPVPEPTVLLLGMHRSALVVDAPGTPYRKVSLGYKATGLTLMQLTMFRGTEVSGDAGQDLSLGGTAVHVTQHATPNGEYIGYTWNREGIAYEVGILLREGLTRELADQVVASIR